MKILIGADLVPTKSNEEYFINGNIEEIIDKEIMDILSNSDFRIFNLEVPLTDKISPIDKFGANLIASTKTITGIKKINPSLFTLANNHILDQGVKGLNSTIKLLNDNNINYIGAGSNLSEAKKPYIIEKDGLKIGIYACAEHEFSIATDKKHGANPFDALESLDHINVLKSECNFVIVLYHGGKEHYRYPSPNLRKVCRKICDKGADLVLCQHTHCIGCEEKYNSSTIVYGQGNFLFDAASNEYWATSLLIDLEVDKDKFEIKYIPVCKSGNGVRMPNNEEEKEIIDNFNKRSNEAKDDVFIEAQYKMFADSMVEGYYHSIYGTNIFVRILRKFFKIKYKRKMAKRKKLKLINIIECEAHHELFLKGLKNEQ